MVRTFHTFDAIIIGAGTAGLSALQEALKHTDNVLLIHDGPMGTTCARTGCIPSKSLIEAANLYHSRHRMAKVGITGTEHLTPDIPDILKKVRSRREEFVTGVQDGMRQFEHYIIKGKAQFESATKIRAGHRLFHTKATIIATGSSPIIPRMLESVSERIVTSDSLFELKDLPPRIAVLGLGPVGIEMAQALARLGISVTAIHKGSLVAGLSDPDISAEMVHSLKEEMQVCLNTEAKAVPHGQKEIMLKVGEKEIIVDMLFSAIGRAPNLQGMGLKKLGISLNDDDVPYFNPQNMQIPGFPIFIAGDVTDERAILHEAADEGKRAGYYAATGDTQIERRKVPLNIVFTEPNIAIIGESAHAMRFNGIVTGEATFSRQGRARIKQENAGKIRIFVNEEDGRIRGCEMLAPDGEHLAHLIALAIQQRTTVTQMLKMPFYHPTLEEGVRIALRDAYQQMQHSETKRA